MAALTFTTLQTELLVALAQAPPPYNVVPPDFASLYPRAISYAETRICMEIPLLAQRTQNTTLSTVNGNRQLNLAAMTPNPIIVQESLSLLVAGTYYAFDKTTLDFIDLFWPTVATTMNPANADNIGRYWAPLDNSIVVIAPTPDAVYTAQCTGLFSPVTLSSINSPTYISTTYPDLLVAGCMVFMEGTMKRNFGAQSDAPQAAVSWEGVYTRLRDAAKSEEARRRGLTPDLPTPPQAQAA